MKKEEDERQRGGCHLTFFEIICKGSTVRGKEREKSRE